MVPETIYGSTPGQCHALRHQPDAVLADLVGRHPRYIIPARQGRAVRLAKGQSICIINTHGTQVCDTWAFNAANGAEYLSWPHARAWINRAVPIPGDALSPIGAGRFSPWSKTPRPVSTTR